MYLFRNIHRLEFDSVVIDETAIEATFPHLTDLIFKFNDNHPGYMIVENVKKFLHANQRLRNFELTTAYEIIPLNMLLHIIGENTSILKLKLCMKYSFTDVYAVELNRFIQEHPLVEELFFKDYRFSNNDAIMFIRQLNSLKTFQFQVEKQTERQLNRLLRQLDSKWQHTITKRHSYITITLRLIVEHAEGDS